ncbi:MAG: prepilin-type N-terminal cleavage/methylation domain-containing protein [Pseudomonadota bacterium]
MSGTEPVTPSNPTLVGPLNLSLALPPNRVRPVRLLPTKHRACGMSVRRYTSTYQQGLTLLEVLVTLGIIAAVAGIGVQVFTTVSTNTSDRLVRLEMREVANAIQRFRQDTGYWPKQGPFENDTVGFVNSPADFSQLFIPPNDGTANIIEYDLASGTGWNGPYLSELEQLEIRVGTDLEIDGEGSITLGLNLVLGVGDPFNEDPLDTGLFEWIGDDVDGDGTRDRAAILGRPYLLFTDDMASEVREDGTTGPIERCDAPCLVSAGPDGEFDTLTLNGQDDDIVVNIGALN